MPGDFDRSSKRNFEDELDKDLNKFSFTHNNQLFDDSPGKSELNQFGDFSGSHSTFDPMHSIERGMGAPDRDTDASFRSKSALPPMSTLSSLSSHSDAPRKTRSEGGHRSSSLTRFSPMSTRKVTALGLHESESEYSPSKYYQPARTPHGASRMRPQSMRKVSPKSFRDTAQLFKELGLEDSMQQGNVTTMQPGQSFRLPRDIPDLSTLMSSSRKAGHKVIESVPLSEDNQKLFVALQDLQLTIDATTVEDAALRMTLDLLNLSDADWPGRTLTTGATASNLLGLACGRNFALQQLGVDVGEEGFSGKKVPVFCAGAHASIKKAASIIGIGRSNCIDVSDASDKYGVAFDTPQLGLLLRQNKELEIGSIVVAAIGEVNTGLSTPNIALLRTLCDTYGAWLHIDAAFAVFAGVYGPLARMLLDLRYGDSLCIDGHKWLNVPYDCATFYTKHLPILKNVCASGPAAYLTSSQSTSQSSESIESPLNIGIENSRRFRAFPLYATLVAYGRAGYADMIHRNLDFARSIDNWLRKSVYFEVLTPQPAEVIGCNLDQGQFETTNIVLFTVRTDSKVPSGYHDMNDVIAAINSTSALYVTGTVFHGRPAARLAVSNWRTGLARESRTGGNTTEIQRSEDLGIVLSTLARLLPRHEDGA